LLIKHGYAILLQGNSSELQQDQLQFYNSCIYSNCNRWCNSSGCIPKFETVLFLAIFYGDKILARVNSGEMIANSDQQKTHSIMQWVVVVVVQ
jgi:hypothetical protein